MPKDGDRAAVIEDVVTAGTSIRETIALFEKIAKVDITALFISVDRMERGTGTLSA
jgi:orotate phosphoribosyltransferase